MPICQRSDVGPRHSSIGQYHFQSRRVSVLTNLRCVLIACVALVASYGTLFAAEEIPPNETEGGAVVVRDASDSVVSYINEQLKLRWAEEEPTIKPSEVADDSEWIRRVYLDIVGHIPSADEVEEFLADKDDNKRKLLVEKLLADPAFVGNWTTIWSNLAIGRQTQRGVSRVGMEKFFREAFATNRPWNEVVVDLLTSEGHYEEQGAVNYLLAQMAAPDEGVQATAKSARLFLGLQVQCTQCHNHPFNEWKQAQFWQFNSFFRQIRRVDHRKYDPQSGRMVDDFSEIVAQSFEGPVFFENRAGEMQVAYPKYFDHEVDPGTGTNRRVEFARLITEGERPFLALAFVNRMWGHFFGYGFTKPVDDLGPHNHPSHPDLLDRLADEFVASGYDVKQLIRWITNCEAYGLTSRMGKSNRADDPSKGQDPLFSRMYVKSLEAEQLYDSLLIATGAERTGGANWEAAEEQRQKWLSQFVVAFGTDENDEVTTFNGSIPQALMLMNGELVEKALAADSGTSLRDVLMGNGSDTVKIRRLFLATLSRNPTRREFTAAGKLLSSSPDKFIGFQDLFWALLNSNEFIFNH